jgi:hypothetical protein
MLEGRRRSLERRMPEKRWRRRFEEGDGGGADVR